MKVCIVTVYNSINSGSYWQANSLGKVLEKMGHEVVYLKRNNGNGSSSSKLTQSKEILKKFLKYGVKEADRQIKMFKEFDIAHKNFKVIENQNALYEDIDCFILGSDTIWNLDSAFFAKNYKIYFGGIFDTKKVISFAASVGNTSIDVIKKYDDIPQMLDNMYKVLVRDEETLKIVNALSKNNPEIVCDPTLLMEKKEYQAIEPILRENKYIFLYLFSELSEDQVRQLKEFADKNELKIISGVKFVKYADECIVNAPNSFLNYMLYAEYIITDTFHGTIFSINLEKEFIVIDRDKKKVTDVLERFDLKNRLISNEDIKFGEKIDYDITREKVKKFRDDSKKMLEDSLK